MSSEERRHQVRSLAAHEFATHGLAGASMDTVAELAGISQAYIFRIFGTKKALFLEVVEDAFTTIARSLCSAAAGTTGSAALDRMGPEYLGQLSDRTRVLLQLQGITACDDPEVRDVVRACYAELWDTVATVTGLDDVAVKSFLGLGLLMSAGAAMDITDLDQPWARGIGTPIRGGLFDHLTTAANRPPIPSVERK